MAVVALAAGSGLAWNHPLAPAAVLAGFLLWCAAVAWRPGIWLFIVPAALPLLNFGPWTGWVVFEEFDLLLLGVVAGAYARMALTPATQRGEPGDGSRDRLAFIVLAALFGALSVVALARGMSVAGDISFGLFQGYSDPLNGWRVFKSLLFAALVWPLLRQEMRAGVTSAVHRLSAGMLVGLTVVALAAVWERTAYAGLWDFSIPYRTTALFWEMHVGGAAIDVYLVLATPFVAWALWTTRSPLRWAVAAALALLVAYACLTTFSRGVYLAVAGPLMLLGVLLRMRLLSKVSVREATPPRWRPAAALALALALALEVAAVLGLGTFMRDRIARSDDDLGSRLEHWQHGLGLMQGPVDWALGIGLGRLPAAYAQGVAGQEFPGDVQFVPSGVDARSGSVKISGPKTLLHQPSMLALTQRVALHPVLPYQVAFDVRTRTQADVYVQLCEMHLLYPRNCQAVFVRVPPTDAQWRQVAQRLRGPLLDPGDPWAPRLGVFSIAVINAGGAAEFDTLSLAGPDGAEMLVNRGFSAGLARWFPAAQGYYVPWHIDNLYLELLIERGLPACVAFLICMAIALRRLVGAAGRAVPIAPFLAASLCGALCVGLVSSVMDVPRVAFLLFLLTLFAVEITACRRRVGL